MVNEAQGKAIPGTEAVSDKGFALALPSQRREDRPNQTRRCPAPICGTLSGSKPDGDMESAICLWRDSSRHSARPTLLNSNPQEWVGERIGSLQLPTRWALQALYAAGGVMPSLTVRGIESDLKRRLRIRAAENGRSMEEVRVIPSRALNTTNGHTGLSGPCDSGLLWLVGGH